MLRRKNNEAEVEVNEVDETTSTSAGKGRPTPKRRTQTGPVSKAPRTRKEAVAWQKEQRKKQKEIAGQKKLTVSEFRELHKAGDPRALPGRDQGPMRALARDYVDSRRMASNYLLALFPFMVIGYAIPIMQLAVLVAFTAIVAEWWFAARGIKRIAAERGITTRESNFGLAMYAGSRAYFPRSWRRPAPRYNYGDKI